MTTPPARSAPIGWRALFSRRNAMAWAVLVIALLANLAAWQYQRERESLAAERQFELLASEVRARIEQSLYDHEQVLRGGAALFDASQEVDRDEWRTYVQRLHLPDHYPGIQGLGFSQVLEPEALPAFEARLRGEGFAGFRLHPPGERDRYSSILYLEPFDERNRTALGYDMLAEPIRRSAMLAAAQSGQARISGKLSLPQVAQDQVQAGVVMYVPLYRADRPQASPEQRLLALRGFIFSPYRMHDLMAGILGHAPLKLDFALYAGAEGPATLLFSTDSGAPRAALLERRQQLVFYRQTWTLSFRSLPAFEAAVHQDLSQLLLGLGGCLLLFALASLLTLRREQAEALARQMTEQIRQGSEALRQSEERQRLVLKGSNDGWWDLDLLAGSFYASARAWEMLGYSADERPQDPDLWRQAVHPEDAAGLRATLRQAIVSRAAAFKVEVRLLHRDGSVRAVLLRAFILRDAQGWAQRVSGMTLDLTERKRVEQMKSEFVSTVSHELRTPLTAIAGALGLINGGALGEVPASMAPMLAIAQQNSQRLGLLVNDLLDMDKLIAGKVIFDLREHDLCALLDESLASNQAYAEQLGVRLVREPGLPSWVRVDGRRLQQVLANLLSNAIKFSPAGAQVQLSCRVQDAWVRVCVQDQGPGVPAAFRERAFQKFSQADATDSRQKGGTGLGLAISKELVERMGGRIGFDSVPGQGATFWFELALLDSPPLEPQPAAAAAEENRHG